VGPTQPPIQWHNGIFRWGKADDAWSWPLPSILAPRLTMSGAIPLVPLYIFMAWTRTLFLFIRLPYRHTRIQLKEKETERALHGPSKYWNGPFYWRVYGQVSCASSIRVPWYYNLVRAYSVPVPYHKWVRSTGGTLIGRTKPKFSKKNISQCHFVHHKSHMDYRWNESQRRQIWQLTTWALAQPVCVEHSAIRQSPQ
jgi:hypothetical protein